MSPEQILSALRERLVIHATSKLENDRSAAEDLASDALLVLTEKYSHLDKEGDIVPMGIAILNNLILNHRRKRIRRKDDQSSSVDDPAVAGRVVSAEQSPLDLAERSERLRIVEELRQELGDPCQEIIRRRLAGSSAREVGEALGIANIDVKVHRCFDRLKKLVRQRVPELIGERG